MNARELPRLCLIEDDAIMGESLCDRFRLEGFAVDWLREAGSARRAIADRAYATVISDILLPDRSGEELYRELLALGRALPPFVFITGYGTIDGAVALLKLGAADYVTKPFDLEQLVAKVRVLSAASGLAQGGELGVSAAMQSIAARLPRIASQARTLLISGESGVGKERIARAFHALAHGGAERPFVAVNCGAIAESLIESELFGHERGAFTGAIRAKRGYFELAHGGTLFLDEISELALALQVKLLRIIQERQVRPLGSKHVYHTDVRFLAATNRDLKTATAQGLFRADLFYRINVINIHVPPLRDRGNDVETLARHFIELHSRRLGKRITGMTDDLRQFLHSYRWPGNVRELENLIERAVILADNELLSCKDFVDVGTTNDKTTLLGEFTEEALGKALSIEHYIEEFVRRYQHAHSEAELAAMLGIGRKALWVRRNRWGLRRSGTRPPRRPSAEA